MQSINHDAANRISVFKEVINEAGLPMFNWYRAASKQELLETGQHIIVESVLTAEELWERLEDY